MNFIDVLHKITLVFGTATPAVLFYLTGLGFIKLIGFAILVFFIAQHLVQLFIATSASSYATVAAKMLPSLTSTPTISAKFALEILALLAWMYSHSYIMVLLSVVHIGLYLFLALRSRLQ